MDICEIDARIFLSLCHHFYHRAYDCSMHEVSPDNMSRFQVAFEHFKHLNYCFLCSSFGETRLKGRLPYSSVIVISL